MMKMEEVEELERMSLVLVSSINVLIITTAHCNWSLHPDTGEKFQK
jgi:hypothetical protein